MALPLVAAEYHFVGNTRTDILSGLTVALALVPEAIAFAFVAHVEPLVGLYAAFFVGFITSLFGGRSGMISGATGAMAVVMVGLVIVHGVEYLFAAIILTGIIQMSAGLMRLGKFIRLVPYPVMLGFVNGLAIVIFLSQLGQFKNTNEQNLEVPATQDFSGHNALDVVFSGGWIEGGEMLVMLALTLLTMALIVVLPKVPDVGKLIPAPLASIIIVSILAIGFNLDTKSVGDLASVSGGLPVFHIPAIIWNLETLLIIIPYAFTLAGIGLVESLLTLTLIDEITDTKGNPNVECMGQGLANFACGFFKAMGGCAMIGQ
ncbi:SulP family inorganic anion transporter, partial [Dehalococcoidia bacterium]|nr:SulP family inorganic anion transporter [Dehalococcoidia bacterium]